MPQTIKVYLKDGSSLLVKKGTPLIDIAKKVIKNPRHPILGAIVNNKIHDLWEEPTDNSQVIFIDHTNPDGYRILTRGFTMVLVKAARDLFPDRRIKVLHSLSKGLFCRWSNGIPMNRETLKKLKKRMDEIIKTGLKFERTKMDKDEALELFKKEELPDKSKLLKFRRKKTMKVYTLEGYTDYFFGRLPPSTDVLGKFELRFYSPGLILRFPTPDYPDQLPPYHEQTKVAKIYSEYKKWIEIMEVSDIASLNNIIMNGEINDLIRVAEALHEKKIARIADEIAKHREEIKLILIAGPSSSGKTTFAQRLRVQLIVNGFRPITVSLDDYFVDKDKTPLDEDGNFDFDHIDAIDIALFNEHLQMLMMEKEVFIPRFDFKLGRRIPDHKKLRLSPKNVLMVEGIHGLNKKLSESVPPENKFKIYVSALTALNLDNHNRIPTTDTRIIRRIVRDSRFRNHTAMETIYQWPSVRRGEENFIFPFQEEADVMFNSALIYELAVLKSFVEPLLRKIPPTEPAFAEAKRLLSFTDNFLEIGTDEIPPNSILREFIGATCFFKMEVV
ncbi:MAG: nucleoside kinase [Vulcanimicrobiota bacterium]